MKSSQTKLDHKLGKDHHDYHDKKVTWIIINSCIVCKVIHWITKLIQIANAYHWQPCAYAAKRNFETLLKFLLKGWILKKSADKWFQARTFATGHPAYAAYNVYCPFIARLSRSYSISSSVPMENGQKTVQANFRRVTTHRCQSGKPLIGCFSTQSWGWWRFIHERHRNRRGILKEGKE